MANQSRSNVQVTIGGTLDASFNKSFTAADKRMADFRKATTDLNKKVGDVDGFRKQAAVLRETSTALKKAQDNVKALRQEMAASEAPTRKQAAAMAAAEKSVKRAGAAYSEARVKYADMSRELQKQGVVVTKLTGEYKRLGAEVNKAAEAQAKAERSLARQQRIVQGMATAWRGIGAAVAGSIAGGMALKQPLSKGMNYDEQLARLSDTAVSGGKGYGAAKGQLSAAVQAALKASGGGKREDVMGGLSALISSGGMSVADASQALVPVARTAFASNTPADQIAQLALKMKGFGVSDTGAGMDVLYRSGQKGGVELSNMAQALPEQLGAARASGYSGLQGLSQIAAMNQVALSTAGDPAQAANNVTNLLNKLSSRELSKNVKKETGVDFDKYALENQKNGIYKAESFAMLADKQMMKDKRYASLKKESESSKTPADRAAKINEMASMLEGSGMGALIQDRQALAAALAMVAARKSGEFGTQQSYALNGAGGVSQSLANLGGETFAKTQTAQSALDSANEQAFNQVSGPLGKVLDGFNAMAETFPKLTTAAYGAATALTAIAAAGLGAGGYKLLAGGGGALAAGGAAAGGTSMLARAGGFLGKAGRFLKGGIAAGLGGYAIDAGAGALGAGGNKVDAGADDRNWNSMGWGQKAMSSIPRGIEKAGSLLFLDNIVNSAKASRIDTESKAYLAAQEAAKAAAQAATAAQNRPNVSNTYNVSVTAGSQAAEVAAAVEKAMSDIKRKSDADRRSSMTDNLGH